MHAACKDANMEASPSRTALWSATARGWHRLWDAPPWVFDDPFALVLVGPAWLDIVATFSARPEHLFRGARADIIVRSRYAEDRLTHGTFSQYVILGAGLDSFAWRRPDLLGTVRVFEVDHPSSQEWKRQRIEELALPTSEQHVFAPIDFEVQTLHDGLDAAGFDWTQPSMFSWLGVTVYLTSDAIETTLQTVAACGSSSEIVLEYWLTEPFLDDGAREWTAAMMPVLAAQGEPWLSRWSPTEAEQAVERCGLRVADHPSRDDLFNRYFANRSDDLRPDGIAGLMAASVP
jgi:methyltransferase (TIGR00027 family)